MRRAVLAGLLALMVCAPAQAADRTATPSTFQGVLAAAQPGDTVLLASGAYGAQSITVQKAGRVTVRPAPGASVSMSPTFSGGARNLTFTGFSGQSSLGHTELRGASTRDITVSNSRFLSSQFVLLLCGVADANILIEGNVFLPFDAASNAREGRLHIAQPNCLGTSPVGVTVRGNLFQGPGDSDGIQVGSHGVVIEGNEFTGFVQGNGRHVDPIQFYGQRATVFRGNWIHDNRVAASMMVADGARQEIIENNILDSTGSGDSRTLNLGSDTGSIVRHNTMVGTFMYKKASCCSNVSTGTIIRDNIVTLGISRPDGSTPAEATNNLLGSSTFASMSGTNIVGKPAFEGGPAPQSRDGYRLSSLSLGYRNASDGTDRGVAIGATVPDPDPTPTPTPTPDPTPDPTPSPTPTPEPTPEPGYTPACRPNCDQIIAARDTRITALEASLAAALARIAAALDALE